MWSCKEEEEPGAQAIAVGGQQQAISSSREHRRSRLVPRFASPYPARGSSPHHAHGSSVLLVAALFWPMAGYRAAAQRRWVRRAASARRQRTMLLPAAPKVVARVRRARKGAGVGKMVRYTFLHRMRAACLWPPLTLPHCPCREAGRLRLPQASYTWPSPALDPTCVLHSTRATLRVPGEQTGSPMPGVACTGAGAGPSNSGRILARTLFSAREAALRTRSAPHLYDLIKLDTWRNMQHH